MEISAIQNNISSQAPAKIQQTPAVSAPETSKEGGDPIMRDTYIPSDRPAQQSIGLYRVVHDEDGTPKIQFDTPESPLENDEAPEAAGGNPSPERKAEKTTTDTDKVDREIEKLKEQKSLLEQRLRAVANQPEAEKLEKELAQVERELSQKDNDAYRRQNAVIS